MLRQNALSALMALAGSAIMAWLALTDFAWTDYEVEVLPAFEALVHGHVETFLRLAPAYGGSLVERAPFALLPGLWGGGALAVYRMATVPCLLAAAGLGVFLLARMRATGYSTLARAVALGLCVANPITMAGLEFGHAEDLLGGCMCVAAVLLAERRRTLLAGVVLGLAIANKEWALLAVGPALLVLPPGRRWLTGIAAAATSLAILAPLALASAKAFAVSARTIAAPPSPIFQPWQIWWFFGKSGGIVRGASGQVKFGYRVPPAWPSEISHPLIVLLGVAIAAALWWRLRGRPLALRDALLALSLVLLLRCMLDTWDNIYYTSPFVLALLAWEVHGPATRPPALALSVTVLIWLSFEGLRPQYSPDVASVFYLAWSLPLAAWLAARLLAATRPALAGGSSWRGRRQEMTASSLERLVSTS
jgi:hypothetical protein